MSISCIHEGLQNQKRKTKQKSLFWQNAHLLLLKTKESTASLNSIVAFMNLSQRCTRPSHRSWLKQRLNTTESTFIGCELFWKPQAHRWRSWQIRQIPWRSNIPSIATCKPLSEHVPLICCVPLSSLFARMLFHIGEQVTCDNQILVDW